MKVLKAWFMGLALCGIGLVASCGGKATVDGTDSNTHWLQECEADDDCGGLSCICGVCTRACDETANCAAFGAKSACEVPAGCTARGPTACVAQSSGGGSGGGNGSGGTSNSGAGTPPVGGSPAQADCDAMDARNGQDVCLGNLGFAWNGKNCEMVQCDCQGADCDALFATADECDHAYRACYVEHGVPRVCKTHADCQVVSRTCCSSCSQTDDPGQALMAVSIDAVDLNAARICNGDPSGGCDDCVPFEYWSVYAACVEGECRLLDVTPHAHCETAADCHLTTRDCCSCGGDFTSSGLIAVDSSFVTPDYCSVDVGCPECEGDAPQSNARLSCREGVCSVGYLPI